MGAGERVAEFTVTGEPVSKSRARFTKRGSKTVTYTPERTKDGERRMALTFRSVAPRYRMGDAETAYRVEAHFYSGTRQRRDVDNMLKLILDGLNGVAWVDDNQVTQIQAAKSYVDKAEARTDVRIFIVGSLAPPKSPCARCGKSFLTYASNTGGKYKRRFCSRACSTADSLAKNPVPCAHCGNQFVKGMASQRYCSIKCSAESKKVARTCDECGKSFQMAQSTSKNRKAPHCSTDCRAAARIRSDTHCVNGHLWELYIRYTPGGRRRCSACAHNRYLERIANDGGNRYRTKPTQEAQ